MPEPTTTESVTHQLAMLQYQAAERTARNTDTLLLVFVWIPLAILGVMLLVGLGLGLASWLVSFGG